MDNLIFISQTPADDAGDYTMRFQDTDGNFRVFHLNLFNLAKVLMESTESGAKILKSLKT
jgi:hypothetical protein